MKRVRIDDLTVGSCKIDGNLKTKFTTSEYIVQEGFLFLNLKILENKFA
jgi:hypothetical protein